MCFAMLVGGRLALTSQFNRIMRWMDDYVSLLLHMLYLWFRASIFLERSVWSEEAR